MQEEYDLDGLSHSVMNLTEYMEVYINKNWNIEIAKIYYSDIDNEEAKESNGYITWGLNLGEVKRYDNGKAQYEGSYYIHSFTKHELGEKNATLQLARIIDVFSFKLINGHLRTKEIIFSNQKSDGGFYLYNMNLNFKYL